MIKVVENQKPVLSKFGGRVREFRISVGLTQVELAQRAGLNRTYIGAVERGEKNISLDNMNKIASGLEVPISELFSERS